ncbi:hypothetical protein X943_000588 [Babesia divergens]|uniref:Uncharacterized protein n=1 Tax=Babesia divergens TaxID=32595 RepID=A0AAD9LJ83_BABDI|nr:hypothetical protein X943_000588 [Babesia divergens]
MPNANRDSHAGLKDGRCSVLDTLLLRPGSEGVCGDFASGRSSCGSLTPYGKSDASSTDGVGTSSMGMSVATIGRGTRTPTSRAEQLELLLSRNYYSAPACSLDFVNLTSSIRDSGEEVFDLEPTLSDVATDEFRVPPSTACPVLLSFPSVDIEPFGVGMAACDSPFTGSVLRTTTGSNCSDDIPKATEPPVECCEDPPTASALMEMHTASEAMAAASRSSEPPTMAQLDRFVRRTCMDISTSPLSQPAEGEPPSSRPYVPCGVDASTSPMGSAARSIPVYSRSLLYRIRVPLAQRLRNACSNFCDGRLSERRLNLSCERRSVDLPVNLIGPSAADLSSGDSSTRDDDLGWYPDESRCNGADTDATDVDMPHAASDYQFRKKRRFVSSARHRRNSHGSTASPNSGLLVFGELWPQGSMRCIGPVFHGTSTYGDGDTKLLELNQLLARHFYLCTGSNVQL